MDIVDISTILYKDDKQWSINVLKENEKVYIIRKYGKINGTKFVHKEEILKSRDIVKNYKKYIRFAFSIRHIGPIIPYKYIKLHLNKYINKNSLIHFISGHLVIEKEVNHPENIIEEYAFLKASGKWLAQVINGFDTVNQNTTILKRNVKSESFLYEPLI
tara:strand:- start:241 stop:720 length:480 start_codon:yes stop_codon:yes gene_type:complete